MQNDIRQTIKKIQENISSNLTALKSIEHELISLRAELRDITPPAIKQKRQRRQRRLSYKWILVLQFIGDNPSADIDEMMAFIKYRGLEISRSSVRGQICLYLRKKLIKRTLANNLYSLTEEGIERCGYIPRVIREGPPTPDSDTSDKYIPF